MSLLPFPESVGVYSATIYPRNPVQPHFANGGEPYLYADAEGNPVWISPQGTKNGYVEVKQSPYEASTTDRKIAVNLAAAVTVFLPEQFPEGELLYIWDAGGHAGVAGQEITIQPPTTQQINSLSKGVALVLSKTDARVSLIRVGARWNVV